MSGVDVFMFAGAGALAYWTGIGVRAAVLALVGWVRGGWHE